MIKLATVFSGIGAVEHALERMGLEHEIVFACDNGDVDVLSQKISNEIPAICQELENLRGAISALEVTTQQARGDKAYLEDDLGKCDAQLAAACTGLAGVETGAVEGYCQALFPTILAMPGLQAARKKEYLALEAQRLQAAPGSDKTLRGLRQLLALWGDFTKDNGGKTLAHAGPTAAPSADHIQWAVVYDTLAQAYQYLDRVGAKKIVKATQEVCEKLAMLHERIAALRVRRALDALPTYQEKKHYVDQLYAGQEAKNKVRASYLANYALPPARFHWNVSFLDGKQYRDQVDLFVGGSPCQSFSLVGKQRGLEDTRGTLFYEYARLVQEINPKVFLYENVKAVLSNDNGQTWETMKAVFADLNYAWSQATLNAKDFGVPQNRERLFVVGIRKDIFQAKPFTFPTPVPLERTMQDYLLDHASGKYYLPKKGVDFVTSEKNITKRYTQIDGKVQLCQKKNQQFNWHGDFIFVEENKDRERTMKDLEKYFLSEKVKKYVLATGTKGFYSRPKIDLEVARPLLTTMHKMHRAGVDNYVTTEGRLRKLTPRECLRLMGFCDSFKIVVSDTAVYQQAGNSIVVDVLMAIVGQVLESVPALLEPPGLPAGEAGAAQGECEAVGTGG